MLGVGGQEEMVRVQERSASTGSDDRSIREGALLSPRLLTPAVGFSHFAHLTAYIISSPSCGTWERCIQKCGAGDGLLDYKFTLAVILTI